VSEWVGKKKGKTENGPKQQMHLQCKTGAHTRTGSDPAARTPGDCCICPRPPPTAPYVVIPSIHSTELGVGRELFIAGMFLHRYPVISLKENLLGFD